MRPEPRPTRPARVPPARAAAVLAAWVALAHSPAAVAAPDTTEATQATPVALAPGRDEAFAVHGQLTYVEQESSGFHAPYRGPNSLSPDQGRETADATLFLGVRLWRGAEGWLTPELDQGFGLDDTLGLAGFPSGEAYKVGRRLPYLRLPRAFLRQTLDLGGPRERVEAQALQLDGSRDRDRLVVTVGKFGVGDVFDASRYAHDPRADFLNWSVIDSGVFDYAADAWGFTVGAAAEWYTGDWTLRGGAFDLSDVPNSPHLDPGGHEFQVVLELEHRHTIAGHPGKLMLTGYDSRGRMALLDAAVEAAAAHGGTPDPAAVRAYRSRLGAHLTLDQELATDLGFFARAGGAAGNVEAYEFTDIDRSAALGLSLGGARWGRGADTAGLAAVVNAISAERRRYLAAGGLGILIGDGRLPHPGEERLLESYYALHLGAGTDLTLDYQFVTHPAYNRDRGPLSVFALRLHAQF
ncbi:MAG: carbohydrate porin [Proteobacteria bacterium]|nr:carbohydrate porin [Pseudomonadota bacterium]